MAQPAKEQKKTGGAVETYNTVAETVGLVPSLRWKDNVIQGVVVLAITGIAAVVGLLTNGMEGLLVASLVGLLASLLISGAVLMVVGWVRAAKKRRQ
jgi:hypothetical protein